MWPPLPQGIFPFSFSSLWGHILFEVLFYVLHIMTFTLESGIDVGQGINLGPEKFVKKNKRRALNKHKAWTKFAKLCYKKTIKLENICRPWKRFQNLINVGPGKNPKLIIVGRTFIPDYRADISTGFSAVFLQRQKVVVKYYV